MYWICSTILSGKPNMANHVHVLIRAPSHVSPAKIAQYLKGKSSYLLQRDFPELKKRYWGQHLWSRGYFCSTVGAVTEEIIKNYTENQADLPETFKVWDQTDLSDKGSPLG
jgi:putative transposase